MTTDKYVEEPIEARPRSMHVIPAGLGGSCAEMVEKTHEIASTDESRGQ